MTGQQLQMPLEALVKSDHEFAPIPYEDNAATLLPFIPEPLPRLRAGFRESLPRILFGVGYTDKTRVKAFSPRPLYQRLARRNDYDTSHDQRAIDRDIPNHQVVSHQNFGGTSTECRLADLVEKAHRCHEQQQ